MDDNYILYVPYISSIKQSCNVFRLAAQYMRSGVVKGGGA